MSFPETLQLKPLVQIDDQHQLLLASTALQLGSVQAWERPICNVFRVILTLSVEFGIMNRSR